MASYIGRTPAVGNFQKCDAISVVNGQATYGLTVNSVAVFPESSNHVLCSLNGILQAPQDSFTISSSNIVFASNLATGDVIDFVMILGSVLDLGVPSDNTVSASKLTNDIISGQTALTSEPADTDEFLVSDAGTIKRIDYSLIKGGGITMADQWRLTTGFTGNANPISSNWERNDTTPSLSYFGSQMTESSGVFTFPSTGIYYVTFTSNFKRNGDSRYNSVYIKGTTDGSTLITLTEANAGITQSESATTYATASVDALLDITDTSNQKVAFQVDVSQSSTEVFGNTSRDVTFARFIRLGDT